jgi:hypothetical protein
MKLLLGQVLIPWRRVVLEKLIVAMVRKLRSFHGSRRFIALRFEVLTVANVKMAVV